MLKIKRKRFFELLEKYRKDPETLPNIVICGHQVRFQGKSPGFTSRIKKNPLTLCAFLIICQS